MKTKVTVISNRKSPEMVDWNYVKTHKGVYKHGAHYFTTLHYGSLTQGDLYTTIYLCGTDCTDYGNMQPVTDYGWQCCQFEKVNADIFVTVQET